MQIEVSLCQAAGIDVSRMAPMDVYLLAGRIIQDFELFKIARGGDRVFHLNAMPASARAALRDRVMGVLAFKQA